MGHALWSLVFVIMGLWIAFFGLVVASPIWFEKLARSSYYCTDCRKILEQTELDQAMTKERYQPRQV